MVRVLGFSGIITALIFLVVCLSPVRWDIKALGPVLPNTQSGAIPPGSSVLFVSQVNDWKAGHIARYGLDLVTFPAGRSAWLVFAEGSSDNEWPGDLLIDRSGQFYAREGDGAWRPTREGAGTAEAIADAGVVLAATPEVSAELSRRWSPGATAKMLVLDGRRLSFLEGPRLRISLEQGLRIFGFVLPVVALAVVMSGGRRSDGSTRALLGGAFALPAFLVIHTGLVSVLGKISVSATTVAVGAEWVATLGLLWKSRHELGHRDMQADRSAKGATAIVGLMVAGYLTFGILSLDFDGDVFTQWLPMARSHHLAGDHDVRTLLARYGNAHEANYPPGFPIMISTVLWAATVARDRSLLLGLESNLAVFLYRLMCLGLCVSFLLAVFGVFGHGRRRDQLAWVFPLSTIPLLLPVFLGRPSAAEVYLVPMTGFAILALHTGAESEDPFWTRLGLFLGAFVTCLKVEGWLVFVLVVLPWYVAGKISRPRYTVSGVTKDLAAFVAGLIPWVAWRMGGVGTATGRGVHFELESVSIGQLLDRGLLLVGIGDTVVKLFLQNHYWVAFFIVLPAAVAGNLALRRGARSLVVPLGVVAYWAAMTLVFVLSRWRDPLQHMTTAYGRLLMVAVLSTLLYGARILMLHAEDSSKP